MQHPEIVKYAKELIKQKLALCTEQQRENFARFFNYRMLPCPELYDTIDNIPVDKTDTALNIIDRTLSTNS